MQLKGRKRLKLVSWVLGRYKARHSRDLVEQDSPQLPHSQLRHGRFSSMHQSTVELDLMDMDRQQQPEAIFTARCFPSSLTASPMSPDVTRGWGGTGHGAVGGPPRWPGRAVALLQLKSVRSSLNPGFWQGCPQIWPSLSPRNPQVSFQKRVFTAKQDLTFPLLKAVPANNIVQMRKGLSDIRWYGSFFKCWETFADNGKVTNYLANSNWVWKKEFFFCFFSFLLCCRIPVSIQ